MRITNRARIRAVVKGLIAAGCAAAPFAASAQIGFYITPSISVQAVHDDNVFLAADPNPLIPADGTVQDDIITRVSPGIEVGYESVPLTWRASYDFDSEWYDEFSELDSWQVRRFANTELSWFLTPAFELTLNGSYGKTQTPGELNLLTGLEPGRLEAERRQVNPGFVHAFNDATDWGLQYTFTNDRLEGGIESDIHNADTFIRHEFSDANTLTFGYLYRKYEFDGANSTDSHTPRIGWLHQFSPRSSLNLEAGPRMAGDDTDAYVLAELGHEYSTGALELSYVLDETTLIGNAGRRENETLRGLWRHRFGLNFEVDLSPAWSQVESLSGLGQDAEVFTFNMNARYRVNNALFLIASYQYTDQKNDLFILPAAVRSSLELERNVFTLGFTLIYPRPGGETEEL